MMLATSLSTMFSSLSKGWTISSGQKLHHLISLHFHTRLQFSCVIAAKALSLVCLFICLFFIIQLK